MEVNIGDQCLYMYDMRVYNISNISSLKLLEDVMICHMASEGYHGLLKVKRDDVRMPSTDLFKDKAHGVWNHYFVKINKAKLDKIEFQEGVKYEAYVTYVNRILYFKKIDDVNIEMEFDGSNSKYDIESAKLLIHCGYWDCKYWD